MYKSECEEIIGKLMDSKSVMEKIGTKTDDYMLKGVMFVLMGMVDHINTKIRWVKNG